MKSAPSAVPTIPIAGVGQDLDRRLELRKLLLGLRRRPLWLAMLLGLRLGLGRRDLDLLRVGLLRLRGLGRRRLGLRAAGLGGLLRAGGLLGSHLSFPFHLGFLFGVATIAMPVTDSYLGSTQSSSGLRAEFRMWPKILERGKKSHLSAGQAGQLQTGACRTVIADALAFALPSQVHRQ